MFLCKNAYDLVKIESGSRKWSHKLDGIRVRRIRMFPVSSNSTCDSVTYDLVKTRLSESEAEAEEPITMLEISACDSDI